jgi:hypothetical protein
VTSTGGVSFTEATLTAGNGTIVRRQAVDKVPSGSEEEGLMKFFRTPFSAIHDGAANCHPNDSAICGPNLAGRLDHQ